MSKLSRRPRSDESTLIATPHRADLGMYTTPSVSVVATLAYISRNSREPTTFVRQHYLSTTGYKQTAETI